MREGSQAPLATGPVMPSVRLGDATQSSSGSWLEPTRAVIYAVFALSDVGADMAAASSWMILPMGVSILLRATIRAVAVW